MREASIRNSGKEGPRVSNGSWDSICARGNLSDTIVKNVVDPNCIGLGKLFVAMNDCRTLS